MRTDYEKTQWVFEHGDCTRCWALVKEPATRTDPACATCQVLDNGTRYSDRCPRLDQYDAAFAKALAKVDEREVLAEEYDRFVPKLAEIVREKKIDAAYEIMAEFERARNEYAERTL